MHIQTVTPARLQEMFDTMTIPEICNALKCTEGKLIELMKKVEESNESTP